MTPTSPTPPPFAASRDDRRVVGINDLNDLTGAGRLVTFGLGSCVAVCLYHPPSRHGFLCHYMLSDPGATRGEEKGEPYQFGSSAIPALLQRVWDAGVSPHHCHVAIAGGAIRFGERDHFSTGARNVAVAREQLLKRRIPVAVEEVGGTISRTVWLDVGAGRMWLQTPEMADRVYDWRI